jgi:hypothetical protein
MQNDSKFLALFISPMLTTEFEQYFVVKYIQSNADIVDIHHFSMTEMMESNSDSSVRAASRSLFFSEQLPGISFRSSSVVTVTVCTAFGNQRPSYSREASLNII